MNANRTISARIQDAEAKIIAAMLKEAAAIGAQLEAAAHQHGTRELARKVWLNPDKGHQILNLCPEAKRRLEALQERPRISLSPVQEYRILRAALYPAVRVLTAKLAADDYAEIEVRAPEIFA